MLIAIQLIRAIKYVLKLDAGDAEKWDASESIGETGAFGAMSNALKTYLRNCQKSQ